MSVCYSVQLERTHIVHAHLIMLFMSVCPLGILWLLDLNHVDTELSLLLQ